jgi:wobble nucleotide-excising tRNase
MINRLQLLRNIGLFDSVDTAANIPLERLTLVYSENGRGKTTLAAILRSLATGDPIPIAERRRLAAQNPPHAVLECSGGPPPAVFQDNAWNRTLPAITVFDDVFIDENVHSGLAVEAHHRQSLHELILGAQAVKLSQSLQELVAKIENHNTALRAKAALIPAVERGPLSVDEFCALPARPDIDEAIQAAERDLAAAREEEAIRNAPPLKVLTLPEFDLVTIEKVLQLDLPALDSATFERVQTHLAGLGQGSEAWVADGMHRVPAEVGGPATGTCPFCAQDLKGSPLIQHYRAYFSEAYTVLKRTVAAAREAVSLAHGGDVPAGFERAVRVVVESRQFWSRFCEVADFTLDTAAIVRDWRTAREAIAAQLTAKQGSPLERMDLSAETKALVATYEAQRKRVSGLNQRLQQANQAIGVVKERAATADSTGLAVGLARLTATKARYTAGTTALCADYIREREAKAATEVSRDRAKAELEKHKATAFPGYQTAINLYLQRFNAGFRLDRISAAHTRGGPTCTYNVVINNTPVPVAGGEATPGEPSFRNTLSAGDRNALALAFFFASLDQDPGLAKKVVVIDDPISSLDEHRALTTVQEIRRLSERVAQVVILSHNKPFLCRLWEGTDCDMRAALEVVRDGLGSTIRTWDVSHDLVTEHDRRHARLQDYLAHGAGDGREVARSIRPHLEAFLRVAYPGHFSPGTLLGPFLNACRQGLGTPTAILDDVDIQELRELVEYANRFHHDTNLAWETEAINDGELFGFVQRALTFAKR